MINILIFLVILGMVAAGLAAAVAILVVFVLVVRSIWLAALREWREMGN